MQTVRKLQTDFGRNEAPYESILCRLMIKFETTGSVLTVKLPGQKRSCPNEEQLVLGQNSVTASLRKSVCRRLQCLDVSSRDIKSNLDLRQSDS